MFLRHKTYTFIQPFNPIDHWLIVKPTRYVIIYNIDNFSRHLSYFGLFLFFDLKKISDEERDLENVC